MEGAGVLQRLGSLAASMYWTWPTALFFGSIAAMLVVMTLLQIAKPTVERRGFLPMSTTRGDRLFIGLLGSAWIHIGWLALSSLALWGGSILAVAWFFLVMRYG